MWMKCNICNAFTKLHANLWSGTNVIPSLEDCVQLFCVAAPCFSERTLVFSCVYDNCNTALSCVLCYFGSFIEKLLIKKGWGKTQDRIIVMMKKLGQKYLNFFMATVTVPHVNHILSLQFLSFLPKPPYIFNYWNEMASLESALFSRPIRDQMYFYVSCLI